jgi:ADP-ribose pyrophosphatase
VEALLLDLVVDDFHLKIRAERAPGYPARLRIPIDEAPWAVPCDGYEPPYHVADTVLAADRTRVSDGWADPEDLSGVAARGDDGLRRDEVGRPLNPRGRTGIAGRGSLGHWGPNRSVSLVAVRHSPAGTGLDILLGSRAGGSTLEIPKGFLRDGESAEGAVRRIVDLETGWACPPRLEAPVYEGYIYDPRQTDHAWIETCVYLLEAELAQRPDGARPGNPFAEIGWWPLEARTVNRIPAVQAGLVREGVRRLTGTGRMDPDEAARLLAATG